MQDTGSSEVSVRQDDSYIKALFRRPTQVWSIPATSAEVNLPSLQFAEFDRSRDGSRRPFDRCDIKLGMIAANGQSAKSAAECVVYKDDIARSAIQGRRIKKAEEEILG